jgi:hypothetical protein
MLSQPRDFIRGFDQFLLVCENLAKLSCFHVITSGVVDARRRQMFFNAVTAITISFSLASFHRCESL